MGNKKKFIWIILYCLMLIFLIISLFLMNYGFDDYYVDLNIEQNNNVNNPINYEEIIDGLKEKYHNDDVVGILEINNTDYSTVIVQGEDNDYYLNHTPDKEKNFMGSIYLDYRVDIDADKKILIYGHNSSKVDMPFKILEEFYDKDYFDNHKYIDIITSVSKKRYEIFSVHVETSDFSYMNIDFKDDKEYFNHLKKLKSKSIYDTGVEISNHDEILILQTCSTHKDYRDYSKKYLLIILRRI